MAYDDEENKARKQTPEEDESQAKIEDLTKGQDELAHADMHSPFDAAHDVAEMVGNTAKVAKEDDSQSDAPIGESPSGDDDESEDSLTAMKASKKALDAMLAEPPPESDDSPEAKVGDSGAGSGGAGPLGIFSGMAEKSMLGAAQPGSAATAAPAAKSVPTFDAATGNMAPTQGPASNPNQDLRAQVQRMMLEKAKSQLSGGDQGLQDAMKKSQLLDAMKPLSNIGAMGDNLANYMAARAGVHNLNSHTPPPGDSDEPVKRYLAMRQAQNQPVDEARKTLAEADKSDEQVVANKIRGQNADTGTKREQHKEDYDATTEKGRNDRFTELMNSKGLDRDERLQIARMRVQEAAKANGVSLTPEAIEMLSGKAAEDGIIPKFGMGKQGASNTVAVANEMAKNGVSGSDIVRNAAENKAGGKALGAMTTQQAKTETSAEFAGKNLDSMMAAAEKIPDFHIKYGNMVARKIDSQRSPEMSSFTAFRLAAQQAAMNVLSSGYHASDKQASEAHAVLDPNATVNQLMESAKALKVDMGNRTSAGEHQIKKISDTIGNHQHGKAAQADAASGAPVKKQYSKSRNQTRFVYPDGHVEVKDGEL